MSYTSPKQRDGVYGTARKMAEPRKSAKQTDARRRAREKAAQFRELQDTLEQLAPDYFVAVDETNEETELEIAKIRKRAEQQTQKARDVANQVIARMVAAGASPAEVAARLGVTSREVKKGTPAPVPADAPPALPVGDERGEETGDSPSEHE